jgi:hypothetical protein
MRRLSGPAGFDVEVHGIYCTGHIGIALHCMGGMGHGGTFVTILSLTWSQHSTTQRRSG